ncbi:uncharacterized protein LOC122719981 isoform X3 [Apis laboriosa]|uniref:uncharacterized protein LOC122719981 isoform X3 n=1 Tax=Apis laboriosa TaxID=183418 RepID=UPI001CC4ACEA|nr:uncharacterized protein LOC122719981 isoform X3 [Apis laboriosa]
MIQPFLEEGAWCYWVVSVGALLCFLGLIVACICSCRRNENKSTGANRSLPDIPKDKEKRHENTDASISQDIYEITETIGDHSELYATVQDTGKEQVSELNVPEILHQNPLNQKNSDNEYLRFPSSPNSENVEHPYAQLQNVQKTEANQLNRNNIKQVIDIEKPSTSTCQNNGNPVAPPRTRRSSSHNSLISTETGSCDIQAANAISGGVQANQDLPYMTPPLLMLLPQPPQSQSNNLQQHFSGDSQDSKGYTSISVREPLANIIAQTKTICRQSQSIRSSIDPHYATVSDDSDEMYAAIDEQDKVYTSGSETYAQIQPTMTEVQRIQNEQTLFSRVPSRSDETFPAPQPPSVDSLRHVAHAHSRQASSSSANSSIVNPGSPKPEKRQANSPLPPPPEGTIEVYASIDKRTKNEDRLKSTLSSGKSLEDMYAKVMKKKKDVEEQQNDAHSSSQGILHSEIFVRKPSFVENNRISSSSHDSMEIQKKESDSVDNGNLDEDILVKSSSSLFKSGDDEDSSNFQLGHNYEPMNDLQTRHSTIRESCDPNYEMLCPQERVSVDTISDYQQNDSSVSISLRNNTDLPTTSISPSSSYSKPFKHRQISNASSEDPGYEKVRLRNRCEIDPDTDSEPNYESMPHDTGEPNYASVCRPGDSDTDPNYESVNHEDPNYESVKYMSVTRTEEPPYEQVNAYKVEQNSSGYEKVKKHILCNTDYEQIHQNHLTDSINGDTDDEQYVQV